MTRIADLKMGNTVGTEERPVYTVLSPVEKTAYGTAVATIVFPPAKDGEEPRVERREWLHPEAEVHVRG